MAGGRDAGEGVRPQTAPGAGPHPRHNPREERPRSSTAFPWLLAALIIIVVGATIAFALLVEKESPTIKKVYVILSIVTAVVLTALLPLVIH